MAVLTNASAEYLGRTSGVSLSQSATTICGWFCFEDLAGFYPIFSARGTGGNICEVSHDDGSGNLIAESGANSVTVGAVPAAGTWFFAYMKLAGSGANQIELGYHPLGGSLITATLTLGNNNTITELRVAGGPFDVSNTRVAAYKAFDGILTAAELERERATLRPHKAAWVWTPMVHASVSDAVKDYSGNGRDLTANGSPTVADGPPVSYGGSPVILPFAAAAPGAYTLTADAGSFALSGQAANLLAARALTADAGAFTLAGQAATLVRGYRVSADAGSYVLTGQTVNLNKGATLAAASGSFSLTGQSAGLLHNRTLTASSGAFTLTGQDATLTYGALAAYTLSADAGAFVFAGSAATLTYSGAMFWSPVSAASGSWAPISGATGSWSAVPETSSTWTPAS